MGDMEAHTVWGFYEKADRAEVDALVACAAERLGIPKPDTSGSVLIFGFNPDRVGEALDQCDPDWRNKGLLEPPDRR